jgi:fructosamine-3-kinase
VSVGEHGRAARKGEFESTLEIHTITGAFTPKPIAWGSFKSLPDTHYYVCKFYELAKELPAQTGFCAQLGLLHTKSESPNGKFGFRIVTYNGDLPQENGYADKWEEFFINGFEHMLRLNIERGGPWEEMESLKPAMLTKVIPRLLKPMESRGRSIKPALVHGDLWCGNVAIDTLTGCSLIYDPASFYAHNECKRDIFPIAYCSADSFQMSSGTGGLKGINSRLATSKSTICMFPNPYPKTTMMIAMLCIPCK